MHTKRIPIENVTVAYMKSILVFYKNCAFMSGNTEPHLLFYRWCGVVPAFVSERKTAASECQILTKGYKKWRDVTCHRTTSNFHRLHATGSDRRRPPASRQRRRLVKPCRGASFFFLSMLRAWAVFNCLIWGFWVMG